jgi:cell shape-determining protein MreC
MGSNDVIALIGIALTFFVSVANLIYSLRSNRRTTFVNTVTTSRLKWINSVRDAVSEFIAVSTRLSDQSAQSEKIEELFLQRETLLHRIVLHLNPTDAEDQRIKALILHTRELSEQGDAKKELPATLTELRDATGNYLKKEWNRAKDESVGR